MNKQQFLGASLHTGLKVNCSTQIGDLTAVSGDSPFVFRTIALGGRGKVMNNINDTKPILRPLSDLTKPITHNGETFVPIVELAKIAYSKLKWDVSFEDGSCYLFSGTGRRLYQFMYFDKEESFSLVSGSPANEHKYVPYQLQLFLNLIEFHFDIANLIEKGEAIDVNSLNENPYK